MKRPFGARLTSGIGLVLYALTILVPLLWVLMSSLKTGSDVFAHP